MGHAAESIEAREPDGNPDHLESGIRRCESLSIAHVALPMSPPLHRDSTLPGIGVVLDDSLEPTAPWSIAELPDAVHAHVTLPSLPPPAAALQPRSPTPLWPVLVGAGMGASLLLVTAILIGLFAGAL